jgi:hypothetical protein
VRGNTTKDTNSIKKNIQYRSNKSTSPSVSDLWNKMRYNIPPLQKEHACLTYNLQAIMIWVSYYP